MYHQSVNDVEEAVNLANKFKQEGKYDWFRGQIGNWKVVQSLLRIPLEKRWDAVLHLNRFCKWVENTAGLENIASNDNYLIAVAQHYLIPTMYVDFTTNPEVAGFFASYGTPDPDLPSCIICLNTEHFLEYWKWVTEEKISQEDMPELIQIDVPNLWRLEAQEGVFLFSKVENLQNYYPFDRITFPYKGLVPHPKITQMYPQVKSNLEHLLEQYFTIENSRKFWEKMRKTAFYEKYLSRAIENVEIRPENYRDDYVVQPIKPHPSWDRNKTASWVQPKVEKFREVSETEHIFSFNFTNISDPWKLANKVTTEFSYYVSTQSRSRFVSFKPMGKGLGNEREELGKILSRLWNGMRSLSYADEQIAKSIGTCVGLYKTILEFPNDKGYRNGHNNYYRNENLIDIQFGYRYDAVFGQAYVTEKALKYAIRDDVGDFLKKEFNYYSDDMHRLLQVIYSPQHLFDFSRFCELFSEQICPSQAIRRKDQVMFFSLDRLVVLGLN